MKKVEVKTTENRRRWLPPALEWNRQVQINLDTWLLRRVPPKKLAWGGLIIALSMLTFTWCDGPTKLQPILGEATFLWAFMWLTVPTVPVGGRVFTTWAGAAARKAAPREITQLQRRGAIIIATCVIFATAWAIYTHDFYTKAYTNFFALGIGTNIAMGQQKWKELKKASSDTSLKKASWPVTILFLSIVPVALFGLVVDVYMSIEGASYESGILGRLFLLMPELVVRTVVPPCYDFLSLFLVGYTFIGLHTDARGWERIRQAANITASGVGWLIGFILLGGYVGGWLADIYRTNHGSLPDQIRQLLAITVVTRAPSYLIGGFGAAVISGLGAEVSGWVRTRTTQMFLPNQGRIAALEEEVATLKATNNELSQLQKILGLPALKYEIENILEDFRQNCEPLLNHVADCSEIARQIQEIEEQLTEFNLTPEALLEIGKNLQQMEEWLKEFRGGSTNRLNMLHELSKAALIVQLRDYPHFESWIGDVREDLAREVIKTRRKLNTEIIKIEIRQNRMHETWAAKMRGHMARLSDRAAQDTRLVNKMEQMLRHH